MPYTVKEGDSAPIIAQRLTGNSMNWPSLKIAGWNGDPHALTPGMTVYLDTEHVGPPSRPPQGLRR